MSPDLSEPERAAIQTYRDLARPGQRRAVRLVVQYAIGAGIFIVLAIIENNPWWAVVSYAVFLAEMSIGLRAARRVSDFMPRLVVAYEARIAELEATNSSSADGHSATGRD